MTEQQLPSGDPTATTSDPSTSPAPAPGDPTSPTSPTSDPTAPASAPVDQAPTPSAPSDTPPASTPPAPSVPPVAAGDPAPSTTPSEPTTSAPAPSTAGPGVGDLVEWTFTDDDGYKLARRGLVLELLDLPGEGGQDVPCARVVELPDAGVIDLDRLEKL